MARADGSSHHSDAREVAFSYIYQLFETWIDLGGLKSNQLSLL